MRITNLDGRLALLSGGGAIDVERASDGRFAADPQQIYTEWEQFRRWADGVNTETVEPFAATAVRQLVTAPRQIFAIGLNYSEHAAESGFTAPEHPAVFTKFAGSLTGPSGMIDLPAATVDWEVEVVAVIGREAYQVPESAAWDHVAGLTVGQDLSERTLQLSGPVPQFSLGKSYPGFSPIGPALVTVDEFLNPDDLELGCQINGELVQKGRTTDLIFSVPELVARLSSVLPLLPGDVIFTGTPAGVGHARTPQRYLRPGDELVSWVEGIGEMRHTFTGLSAMELGGTR
ncbi:fumarylacetoacetate hydrolase family protein [Rhodococcus sp. JS3073]|uniref:fumarylacetoacetate hydrolase family protein n=1 Tax=Rhodococcus sp. JS3073 TaxID=3002901 RepID=UPI002286336B|nr:fumarylacetoacetate hydrolase family protein [Rhodococcus sp. JS3073]WAM14783.1 fumarylacetoacetate hydrolase family protein [Rhodococcus sp. JS3073]